MREQPEHRFTLPDSERENYVLSIFGMKGEGKTYLAQEIAAEERRVVVIDVTGQFRDMETVVGFKASLRRLAEVEDKPRFKLSLWITEVDEVLRVLDVLFNMQKFTLIIDETSEYVSSANLPPEFRQLIMLGRHQAINQIYMSRRPAEINRALTSQSDVIVAFRQHEKRDIDYLSSFMGKELAERARNLGKYEIIAWGKEEKMPLPVLERKLNSNVSYEEANKEKD